MVDMSLHMHISQILEKPGETVSGYLLNQCWDPSQAFWKKRYSQPGTHWFSLSGARADYFGTLLRVLHMMIGPSSCFSRWQRLQDICSAFVETRPLKYVSCIYLTKPVWWESKNIPRRNRCNSQYPLCSAKERADAVIFDRPPQGGTFLHIAIIVFFH